MWLLRGPQRPIMRRIRVAIWREGFCNRDLLHKYFLNRRIPLYGSFPFYSPNCLPESAHLATVSLSLSLLMVSLSVPCGLGDKSPKRIVGLLAKAALSTLAQR